MTTRRPLCLFLQAAGPEGAVAEGALEVPTDMLEAEAVDSQEACVVEGAEVELESC